MPCISMHMPHMPNGLLQLSESNGRLRVSMLLTWRLLNLALLSYSALGSYSRCDGLKFVGKSGYGSIRGHWPR